MESKELKDKIQKTVRENIAISAIKEEINMKKIKNKKIFYSILSTAAMFMICMVVIAGNKINVGEKESPNIVAKQDKQNARQEDLKNEKNTDKININDFNSEDILEIDARWVDFDLLEEFDFLNSIYIPENLDKKRTGKIYVRENLKDDNYSVFNENCIMYYDDSEEEGQHININFSKNKLLPDCIPSGIETAKESIIDNTKVKLFATEMLRHPTKIQGEAYFEYSGYKIHIDVYRITQEEFINVVKSVVKEIKKEKLLIEDKDVGSIENPQEVSNSKDYYAGKYIDSTGKNVILLCEDTEENRADICKELGITESNTIFKKAKYSYKYLTKLQEKISKKMQSKELTFVTTSSLMEEKNNVKVTVTTKDENELKKLKELDTIGGAIEIEYSENSMAHQDLLVEKGN